MVRKLYKISQTANRGYDTYDSFVVCAESKNEAKHYNPESKKFDLPDSESDKKNISFMPYANMTWCAVKNVKVEFIGIARDELKKGEVIGSFNAG